jgi:hypothetical protein
MKSAVIRYRTKPEAADENQRLIENVFAELAQKQPEGLRYSTFRLDDGITFVHVVTDEGDTLPGLSAFQEFQRDLGNRLESGPDRENATAIGGYTG